MYDWIVIALMASAQAGATFAWLKSQNDKGKERLENERKALDLKLDGMVRDASNSLYNAKKDVLEVIKKQHAEIDARCDKLERDHEEGRAEFTQELRNIAETFTKACDGFQAKLEQLTATIIGQYVPRAEIDGRFVRFDEKQDRMLNLLYDLKK
jgi:DNA repair exonuclease SbcCD ATPase subunit